ncbi:hypothetical protein SAMN02745138_01494 [[Clostridium] lactatifermentans DSM 14214]|uniref:Uncharacterized protein n=1 Tax=Anaerotignum lactatifermentans DSM 14214 TaxID=1121323 RepID=A0A1M6RA05_9FIRM|nr:hypothetical protein SAMN02745138_01494 [[Clostridium] lactatifermentans DSM 14214] [Anaerotignum lactatifermentans DSM 14214]
MIYKDCLYYGAERIYIAVRFFEIFCHCDVVVVCENKYSFWNFYSIMLKRYCLYFIDSKIRS